MQEIQKVDQDIRSKVIVARTSGFTQPKFLAFLLMILSIMVLFQPMLKRIPLLYYLLFIAYILALIICIIYF